MANFDLILTGGMIIDGRGVPARRADIGICGAKIGAVGDLGSTAADHTKDVTGLHVAPGLIDAHTHDESFLLGYGDPLAKISQGVTFECVGLCGKSITPLDKSSANQLTTYLGPALAGADPSFDWQDWSGVKQRFTRSDGNFKQASFIGNGTLRLAVAGFENRRTTPKEVKQMQVLLSHEFDCGAIGLSLGLSYPPGVYADLEELISLAKVAARHNKPVTTHMRSEGDALVASVSDMIEISRQTGCAMTISHHKAIGANNYGKVHQTVEMIETARKNGLDVTFDVYPYTAGNTSITALVPPWALDGGIDQLVQRVQSATFRERLRKEIYQNTDWENLPKAAGWEGLMISSCVYKPELEGRTIHHIAEERNHDPVEVLFDLISESKGHCRVAVFDMDEHDVEWLVGHPLSNIISDSTDVIGKPHPRLYGAFTRVLSTYVRERKTLTLEDAISKMTSGPAQRLNLTGRGVIEPGAYADLVVFNPDTVQDQATYMDPRNYSKGVAHVIVDGDLIFEDGKLVKEIVVLPV